MYCTPTIPNYVPTNGLLGWWPFNGNANDESGNGNHGTTNGPVLTTDRNATTDKAYQFDRSAVQTIDVPQSPTLNSCPNMSISLWTRLNSYSASGQAGYNHFVNKSPGGANYQYVLANYANGLYFYYGNGAAYFQTSTLPSLNAWHHLALTYAYDGTPANSWCRFYVDGACTDSFPTTIPLQTTTHPLRFGSFPGGTYNTVDGKVDDIGIWNRVLTPAEITALVAGQIPQVPSYVPPTGLVAWWPLDGNAIDASGNGHNGMITGGVSSATGHLGAANSSLLFDGLTGRIDVPSLNPQPYTPITYSAWAVVNSYFPSAQPGHKFRTIIGRHTGFVLDCGALGFYADGNVGGGAYDNTFLWWRGGGFTGDVPYSAQIPTLNSWVHVVYTQEASGNFKFYTNGALTNSGNFTDAQAYYDFFRIGASNNNTNGNTSWNDKLDDIGVWDRVLTPAEVNSLYNAGAPPPCPDNLVHLQLSTDDKGFETGWEILPSGGMIPVCAGMNYPSNTTITVDCCLPTGCYTLRVTDSFGDGMASGVTGGYVLLDANNERIIDNTGDGVFMFTSQAADVFCVPLGVNRLTSASCDQPPTLGNFRLQAEEDAAVTAQYGITNSTSGYQFWVFDPDGTYSRRVFLSHQTPGSSAPSGTSNALKASYLRVNALNTNPIPWQKRLNVAVRGRVAGVNGNFGPACRLYVDPLAACQPSQLTTTADPIISCGASGLVVDGMDTLYATSVNGATKYQFRFTRTGYTRNIAVTTRYLVLNPWFTLPLQAGLCYDVIVRTSFDDGLSWCAFGPSCQVCLAVPPPTDGAQRSLQEVGGAGMSIWPNPNRGDVLNLRIDGLAEPVTTAAVDLYDTQGRKVLARSVSVNGTTVNAELDLGNELPSGLYLITVTAGNQMFHQRLMVN